MALLTDLKFLTGVMLGGVEPAHAQKPRPEEDAIAWEFLNLRISTSAIIVTLT